MSLALDANKLGIKLVSVLGLKEVKNVGNVECKDMTKADVLRFGQNIITTRKMNRVVKIALVLISVAFNATHLLISSALMSQKVRELTFHLKYQSEILKNSSD